MLKRIRYFVTVARTCHFGRAARELHISQPPLSQQIQLLERELGIALFIRSTRRVELTEAGKALYESARVTVDKLDIAIARAQRVHHGEAGHLRIGFVSTSTFKLLSDSISAFHTRFPDATLELFHMTSIQQAEALKREQIDVGFLRSPPSDSASIMIHREPLVLALPPDHRLARKRKVRFEELRNEHFIMWDRKQTTGIAEQVLDMCRSHGFEAKIVLEVTNPAAMLSLVASNMGIAVVPTSATQLLRQDALIFKTIDDPKAFSGLSLVWRKDQASQLATQFVALVSELAD